MPAARPPAWIIAELEVRNVAGGARRRRHGERHGGAAIEGFRERLLVDRVMRGEPHVVVGKAEVIATLQQDHPSDRVEFGGQRGFLRQAIDLAHRYVDGEIDLTRLDRRDARRRILDDFEDHPADFWLRSPIGVVALEHDAGIELVFDELVGAGANRLLNEAINARSFHVFLWYNKAAEKGEPHRRGRRRLLEFHDRAGRRRDLDIDDPAPGIRGVDLVTGLDALEERVAEIVRRQLVAILERHVVAQIDRHGQRVGREFPLGGEVGHERELRVLINGLVEHELEDRLRVGLEALVRIPGRHIARPAERDRVASRDGG